MTKFLSKTVKSVLAIAALMSGSQSWGQNPENVMSRNTQQVAEDVVTVSASYYPDSLYEGDTVRLRWTLHQNVVDTPLFYRIFRTEASNTGPYNEANTNLIEDSVVGFEYLVTNFSQLDKGSYKYGVAAVYTSVPPVPSSGKLVDESFENGIPNDWILINLSSNGVNWGTFNPSEFAIGSAHNGNSVAVSWSWNNKTYDPNNYMIIPLTHPASSMYYYVATNQTYPDHYGVFVSSTTADPDSFEMVYEETWQNSAPSRDRDSMPLKGSTAAGAPSQIHEMSEWKKVTINVPLTARYIAFRHFNSRDKNYVFVDEVTVYASQSNFWRYSQSDYCWSLPIERCSAPKSLRVSASGLAEWDGGAGTENPNTPTLLILKDTLGNTVFRDTTQMNYVQLPVDELQGDAYYDCLVAHIYSKGMSDTLQTRWYLAPKGPFTITVTAKPLAGGAVFGAGIYQNGDTCTLSVSSYRGYYLSYWSLGDSTVSTDSVYSFVVREDADYTAHFDRFLYQITAQADPADYGTVEGAGTYKHFDAATLLAKPNQGYMFVRWTLNGEEVSNTAMYSFLVTGPAEYVAHFTVFNALEDVKGETSTQKILRDGKLYILRGKRMYDAMGRELKMGN
ncbi:MAG: hypothetical protein E7074_06160 [Bacteroidales bacterium]|jgi:hypothetical protein|nr:hypothetical protein [Bacteroidales bacterium]